MNSNISYHIPVPPRVKIQVRGRIKSHDGITTFTDGIIRFPDGTVALSGKEIFVDAEHSFADLHKDIEIETD